MAKKSKIWEHFFYMFVIFVFVGHHFSFVTSLFIPALIVIIISIFINIYIFKSDYDYFQTSLQVNNKSFTGVRSHSKVLVTL